MSACCLSQSRPRSAAPLLVAAALLALSVVSPSRAQTAPTSGGDAPKAGGVAPKGGKSPTTAPPSAATQAVVAAAQSQVKAGQFAEAVGALTAAQTPGLLAHDKQALDFALADAQQAWGLDLLNKQHNKDALRHFQASIAIDQVYTSRRDQNALAVRRIGAAYADMRQYEKAIEYTVKSLPIFVEAKDDVGEAKALNSLALAYFRLSQYEKAIGFYERALPIYQQVKDRNGEADAFGNLGLTYFRLRQRQKAIGYYEQALPIYRQVKNRIGEAYALNGLAASYGALSQYEKTIGFYEQVLAIDVDTKDRIGEAHTLNALGLAYVYLSQYEKAIGYFEQTLTIDREIKDQGSEAGTLVNLGLAYNGLSQHEKAISYYEQALPILRLVKERDFEAKALNDLGVAYLSLSQYEKAIGFYEQALTIDRDTKDSNGEAGVLNGLGTAYVNLTQYEKAIGYFEQALTIDREIKDQGGEAGTLVDLGVAYNGLSQHEKAIGYYEQALPILRLVKNRDFEARALNDLGVAYLRLNQYAKAITCLEQVLPIYREVKDKDDEAIALLNLGDAYQDLSQYDKAIAYDQQALPLVQQVKNREYEAAVLTNLGSAWSASDNTNRNPRLAILFSKQAVNIVQSIRADIHGLERATQQGYTKSKESLYRDLADLLIGQGRLPEAQQVLGLLKEQEFFDFVRRDAAEATGMGKADLTALEAKADASIRAEGGKVTEAGTRYTTLLEAQKHETDPAKRKALDKQIDAADKARGAASTAFEHVLDSLGALFSASTASVAQKPLDVRDTEALTSALGTLDEQTHRKTVALYTLVGDKTLRFLVYTGSATPVAREYPISAEALNKKVASFRNALQDPTVDPRPLAKQLYDILVGPVKADIAGAEAGEVMWSLDGTLRYLPIAALSPDGVHYLIEQPIGESIFTPATLNAGHLTDATQGSWSALCLGVTGARTVDGDTFPALPGVAGEIGGIVQGSGGGSNTGAGIFPGTPLLDGDFTQESLVHALRPRQFPLVHIASHFRFRPGDEGASYLLLGVGKLTLTDVKDMPADLFRGVDLLTLSACDTAVGGGDSAAGKAGDGSEVESFGVLVQKKGAEAVLATLWPVADASTPALMQAFYRLRQANPTLPKSEALRQAQVALLTGGGGGVKPAYASNDATAPKPLLAASSKDALSFTPNPEKPWAHPYYWAPFILIGNWK